MRRKKWRHVGQLGKRWVLQEKRAVAQTGKFEMPIVHGRRACQSYLLHREWGVLRSHEDQKEER